MAAALVLDPLHEVLEAAIAEPSMVQFQQISWDIPAVLLLVVRPIKHYWDGNEQSLTGGILANIRSDTAKVSTLS